MSKLVILKPGNAVANHSAGVVCVPGVPFEAVDFKALPEWDALRKAFLAGRIVDYVAPVKAKPVRAPRRAPASTPNTKPAAKV